jgi:hypothetical protein
VLLKLQNELLVAFKVVTETPHSYAYALPSLRRLYRVTIRDGLTSKKHNEGLGKKNGVCYGKAFHRTRTSDFPHKNAHRYQLSQLAGNERTNIHIDLFLLL